MTITDTLISIAVVVIFFFVAYSNWKQEKLSETINGLKEMIQDFTGYEPDEYYE